MKCSMMSLQEFLGTVTHTMTGMSLKHDLHMIVCKKELFDRWMNILDLYVRGDIANKQGIMKSQAVGGSANENMDNDAKGKRSGKEKASQISERMFRSCQGLKDQDTFKLQELILTGSILLKKSKGLQMIDMEEMAIRMKLDRIMQASIVNFMANLSGAKGLSYEEVAQKYNISKPLYDSMYRRCTTFLKDSANMAKKRNQELPDVVQTELRVLHAQHSGKNQQVMENPWNILNAGILMSTFTEVITACGQQNDIGLVILDTTSQGSLYAWDTDAFTKLLSCIARITSNDSYVLIAFVPFGNCFQQLESTLLAIQGSVHIEYGGYTVGNVSKKKYTTSHDLCILMAFISKEEGRSDWRDLIISPTIPSLIYDGGEMHLNEVELPEEGSSRKTTMDFFKKPITFESCNLHGGGISKYHKDPNYYKMLISSFCSPGKVVLDAYSGGYAMREALQIGRRAIVLVQNVLEKSLMEAYVSKMVDELPSVREFYDTTKGDKPEEEATSPSTLIISNEPPKDFLMDVMKLSSDLNVASMQENIDLSIDDIDINQEIQGHQSLDNDEKKNEEDDLQKEPPTDPSQES